MLDKTRLVQWQEIAPNGHVWPWWTKSCLTEIDSWDWSNKNVWEFGSGWSGIWLASRAKEVRSVETSEQWIKDIQEYADAHGIGNLTLIHRQVNEGDQSKVDYYTEIPEDYHVDVLTVDGVLRYECIQKALTLPRPLTLIVDNWVQSYVFMCPAAEELLKDFEHTIYHEPLHTDNDGINKWKTAIFFLK